MEIFWRLLFAHLLGDFTLQTDSLVKWKKENYYGVVLHSVVFMVVSYVVCWNLLTDSWRTIFGFSVTGWIAVLVISTAHYAIDLYKVKITNKDDSTDTLLNFLLDQAAHLLIIAFFITPSVAAVPGSGKWWIIGSILIIATDFMAILIYYLKVHFFSTKQPGGERKYVLMADRLVVTLSFLIGSWLFVALPLVWIGRSVLFKLKKRIDYSWEELSISYGSSIILGIFARMVYFS